MVVTVSVLASSLAYSRMVRSLSPCPGRLEWHSRQVNNGGLNQSVWRRDRPWHSVGDHLEQLPRAGQLSFDKGARTGPTWHAVHATLACGQDACATACGSIVV